MFRPKSLEFTLAMMFIPQALLPIVALLYASGIIQDEQEEQTITYLLLRPIPKWAIYSLKLLAVMTTTAVLVAVFTVLTYMAIYFGTQYAARRSGGPKLQGRVDPRAGGDHLLQRVWPDEPADETRADRRVSCTRPSSKDCWPICRSASAGSPLFTTRG